VNGRVAARIGNDDPTMSPHGVYPCTGTDRWVSLACRDDRDWSALAALIGRSDLASLTNTRRLEQRNELNDAVAAWTALRSPAEAEGELIAHGVPAHAVIHSPDIYADPQLAHLGHFAEIPHPHHGTVTVEASRLGLTGKPSTISNGAPSFGLHTVDLLTETLGYDPDRIGELFSSGALD